MKRVAAFASGGGTTFQALLDHTRGGERPWGLVGLVVNRSGLPVEERARRQGLPVAIIDDRALPAEDVAEATLAVLADWGAEIVALAGYLRLVPASVVSAFEGRMVNVHPALLPAFGGQGMYGDRVHQAVLASGVSVSGPTVHLVSAEYDRGAPLAQWPVPVHSGDELADLRARVQAAERALYPRVLDALAAGLAADGAPSRVEWRGQHFRISEPGGDVAACMDTSLGTKPGLRAQQETLE